jgi:elongation factor Ts
MTEITAGMVRELRDKTDAPMMECKKALVEASGDSAKAEELLRIRLGNKASKAASRTAAEGVVAIHVAPDGKTGAIVEVNCETDFVAKTEDFRRFAASLAELAAKRNPADLNALLAQPLGATSVEDARKALVGKIGENMSIRRFTRMEAKGRLAHYIHGGAKIGVLLDYSGGDDQLGRDLAMHVAASKPLGLSKDRRTTFPPMW